MKLVDTREAAAYLGVAPITLAKARLRGDGPRYVKWGRLVRYTIADLDAFVTERYRTSTSERGATRTRTAA